MIDVVHLITSLWQRNGPGSGILAQIAAHDPRRVRSRVWSMYPPPPDRDPQAALEALDVEHRRFHMAGFGDVRVLPALVSQLRRDRPDVLHCHLLRANLYGRLAGALAGVPVILSTLRNIEDYMQGRDWASRVVRWLESRTAGRVSKYVAVSEAVRRAAIRHLGLDPGQIVTILNAVDLAPLEAGCPDRTAVRAELGIAPDAVVFGSVGRLHPQKNYRFLIELARRLGQTRGDLCFLIVGEGEERPALEASIAAHHLGARVRLLGHRRDVPRLLPAFDVFVLTSAVEGLPRALMEAMAAGLPCVVTDAGGNAEAVVHQETGYVWPEGDLERFAGSLEALARDAALRRRLGAAGRARARAQFNARRMAGDYEALYTALLGGARAAH